MTDYELTKKRFEGVSDVERDVESEAIQSSSTNSERETVQVSGEDGDNKGREAGNDAIKFNLDGKEFTMSKEDVENEKELSKGVLKS